MKRLFNGANPVEDDKEDLRDTGEHEATGIGGSFQNEKLMGKHGVVDDELLSGFEQ